MQEVFGELFLYLYNTSDELLIYFTINTLAVKIILTVLIAHWNNEILSLLQDEVALNELIKKIKVCIDNIAAEKLALEKENAQGHRTTEDYNDEQDILARKQTSQTDLITANQQLIANRQRQTSLNNEKTSKTKWGYILGVAVTAGIWIGKALYTVFSDKDEHGRTKE